MRRGRPPGLASAPCSSGAVVTDRMPPDELFADGQLDVIADHGDLDLAAAIGVAGAVVRPGERDVA